MKEFTQIVAHNPVLNMVWRNLKEIDRAKNGYVTTTELDDILKLNFPNLVYRNFKKML